MAMTQEEYTRSFSSFSGADIVCTFNGRIIGELQAIQYKVQREVAPIFTMGSADARSFSRGKRGISGSLIFVTFDRDALLDEMKKDYQGAPAMLQYQSFKANAAFEEAIVKGLKSTQKGFDVRDWDDQMTRLGYSPTGPSAGNFNSDSITGFYTPEYADQLMPFNITINAANEFGQRASMEIYGTQILNEGSGFSVDDVITAKAYTFVARKVKALQREENLRKTGSSTAMPALGDRMVRG